MGAGVRRDEAAEEDGDTDGDERGDEALDELLPELLAGCILLVSSDCPRLGSGGCMAAAMDDVADGGDGAWPMGSDCVRADIGCWREGEE